jgi:hypothetical protein
MDDAGKIAAGLVGAALVLAVAMVGYREFERQRDIAEVAAMANAFMQPITQTMRVPDPETVRLEVQARPVADQRYAADAAERRRQSAQLAPNERCIGGAVVRVEGSSYTQLGTLGQPVHCVDQLADRPLRSE